MTIRAGTYLYTDVTISHALTPLEEFGAHRPKCAATGVVTREPWRGTGDERTHCDCGLAYAIARQ